MALLSDLLVIELASVLAGPSVGMFLAELGARVIKVESPSTNGDVTRSWKLRSEPDKTDRPAYFCAVNWGKESIALNLKSPAGQAVLANLLARADVVITSFIPGTEKRLGLEGEMLRVKYPRLIIAEISGYGPEEPRAAYDAIIQAEAGFTYLNGTPGEVHKMPVALMDVLAAHQLKEAILLALLRRERTGEGSHLHVSLLQSGLASLVNQATNYLHADVIPQPKGSDHPNIVPYGTMFETADHLPVVLAVGNDVQFAALCEVLALPQRPEFATNYQRVQQRETVKAWIAQAIATWSRDDLMMALKARRVPAGAVNDLAAAWQQPQAQPLLLHGDDVAGLRSFVAGHQAFPAIDLSDPPHFDEHGAAIRAEFE